MDSHAHEKRQFKRIIFSSDDGVIGIFRHQEKEDQLIASNIVNISEGGIQFIIKKGRRDDLKEGDLLTLTRIKGKSDLEFPCETGIEIRWILDLNYFDHVGVGCQFVAIPSIIKEQIKQFVERESRA